MRFLIAPDKFKDSMTAMAAAAAMERGIKAVLPNAATQLLPLADGGEGSLEAFEASGNFERITIPVYDPLMREISASFLVQPVTGLAIVEMSKASGLQLLAQSERNPMFTSTFGTGQLINAALKKGVTEILLCIGGSATNDCGIGMAAALGYAFLNQNKEVIQPIGKNLSEVAYINSAGAHKQLNQVKVKVACDVHNLLFGNTGAAHTYGAQKGASKAEIEHLDKGLQQICRIISRDLGKEVSEIPGGGAAGGLGAGAVAFLNAKLMPGANLILNAVGFNQALHQADIVLTGEGKIDDTSFQGKLLSAIAERALAHQKKLVAFGGIVITQHQKFELVQISPRNMPTNEAIQRGEELLQKSVTEYFSPTE